MNRFQQKTPPAVYVAVALSLLGVFVADLYTPLGVAVWVIYLVPVALCLFAWQPALPSAVASAATALTLVTLFTDAPGLDPGVVRMNRGFGLLTVWSVAVCRRTSWIEPMRATSGSRSRSARGRSVISSNDEAPFS